ncbi:BQ2448_4235 [Microbotryum intermedium]|uniref:BQ2448_4235 protein n=1 Tax=Microbotryum intermedium TaxID=269621 RepID=A0A238FNC6_9BASI|nr:BQ2448_4235 [Microbotryum intermedium]
MQLTKEASALEMSLSPTHPVEHAEFYVEGILLDMDGTLVDSIAAVESAWSSVAEELGKPADEVIAATHGRRAIDNLRDLKPQLRRLTNEQMEPHVEEFEKRILREADEFSEKVRSRRSSEASSRRNSQPNSRRGSNAGSRRPSSSSGPKPLLSGLAGGQFGMSKIATPQTTDSPGDTGLGTNNDSANLDTVNAKLAKLSTQEAPGRDRLAELTSPFDDDDESDDEFDLSEYTEEEIGCQDKSVRILPGVRRLIASLPQARYAVATSGAKTYCHGALARAGIKRPAVTITADDPRLKRGKPHPDPFILVSDRTLLLVARVMSILTASVLKFQAAKELGIPVEKCLVFEDSPSGIKAGVASGAKTIAICTSHPVEKISDSGAHYIVPSLDCVHAFPQKDGRIKIVIE